MEYRKTARAAKTAAKKARTGRRNRRPAAPEREENDPPADQLERWKRLGYLWPGDEQMNDVLYAAGVELRRRRSTITVENEETGIAWQAVAGLVLDNSDEDGIGIRYRSIRLTAFGHPKLLNMRARKDIALHMVRVGLERLAKL